METNKWETLFYSINKYIYLAVFLIISTLLLIGAPLLTYFCKKTFYFQNFTLVILDIMVLYILFMAIKFTKKYYYAFAKANADKIILAFTIILFFVQLFIGYNIVFYTGWDVGGIILPAAKAAAYGESMDSFTGYFSVYPNSIFLVWIQSKIIYFAGFFGVDNLKLELMFSTAVNSVISCLTGWLTYECVKKLINKKWALCSWILFVLFIGISPWFVIPYSDSLGLFLPILIFYIYIKKFKENHTLVKWLLIGLTSFIGYNIKPQVIIIFIAIMIVETFKFIFLEKKQKEKKILVAGVLAAALLVASIFNSFAINQTGLKINKQLTFGMTHFAMMGMNSERDGVYNYNDVVYSSSQATPEARKKANIDKIKERLNSFGALGYLKFLEKKALVNYGDGTFAWGEEGQFYNQLFDNPSAISKFLKSFYYNDGAHYYILSTFEQAIWIAVIFSMLGIVFIKKNKLDKRIVVLMMSLVGLTIFEMIFEARARYLYIYAPIFIILSIIGLKNIKFQIQNIITKNIDKN